MANFYQQGQHVSGNQVNAEFADLRGATLGSGRADGSTEAENDLRAIVDAVRKAAELGLLDSSAADAVNTEIRGAIGDIEAGATPVAASRVEKAIKVLQAAAPVAVIAGTLSSAWGALAGGM